MWIYHRLSLINFACFWVAPPQLITPMGSNSNADKMNPTRSKRIIFHFDIIIITVFAVTVALWECWEYAQCIIHYHCLCRHGIARESMISAIVRPCTSALSYLHNQNIIHRDIKSDNVLVGLNGDVKVIDFGACAKVSWKVIVHMGILGPQLMQKGVLWLGRQF